MKKFLFLLGLGAGFLLGSKAGRGPYEKLEALVRSATRRPELRDAPERAKEAAQDRVVDVADKMGEQLSSVNAAAR